MRNSYPNRVGSNGDSTCPTGYSGDGCNTGLGLALACCDPYRGHPNCRIRPLGLPIETVAAGALGTQQRIRPTYPFVGYRIFVDSTVAASFVFVSLAIGGISQLASGERLPLFMFSEVSQDSILSLDSLEGNVDLSYQVQNVSLVEATFMGCVLGVTTACPRNP